MYIHVVKVLKRMDVLSVKLGCILGDSKHAIINITYCNHCNGISLI